MIWVFVAVAVIAAAAVVIAARRRRPALGPRRIHRARRILFPFVGDTVSQTALDAALRLARAEQASLVPVYIATVPLALNIEAPVPEECAAAIPLLDGIEQRAARLDVPVESRIETGRSPRHALRRLVEHEKFDRVVIPASDSRAGFSADDIAWLLENVPGEIVVMRPAGEEHMGHHLHTLASPPRGTRSPRASRPASTRR